MALGAEAGCEGDCHSGSCLFKACLLSAAAKGSVTPTAAGAGLPLLASTEDWTGLLRSAALTGCLPAGVNEVASDQSQVSLWKLLSPAGLEPCREHTGHL